jgi:hypothetical protein
VLPIVNWLHNDVRFPCNFDVYVLVKDEGADFFDFLIEFE